MIYIISIDDFNDQKLHNLKIINELIPLKVFTFHFIVYSFHGNTNLSQFQLIIIKTKYFLHLISVENSSFLCIYPLNRKKSRYE